MTFPLPYTGPAFGPLIIQAYTPEHIGDNLYDRIRPPVLQKLKEIRAKHLADYNSAKCTFLRHSCQIGSMI